MVRVIQETFIERPPAQEGLSPTIFNNSKNLASSSQELRPLTLPKQQGKVSEMKRETQNAAIPSHHFQSRRGMLNHTGGYYSHNGMMDYQGIPISELNVGNFPDSMEFQSWKSRLWDCGVSENGRS